MTGDLNTLQGVVRWFPDEVWKLRDAAGKSVLQIAVEHAHKECVNYLLQNEAVVRVSDFLGSSPVFAAIDNNDQETLTLLLQYGGLNALLQLDHAGNTPLLRVRLNSLGSFLCCRILSDLHRSSNNRRQNCCP